MEKDVCRREERDMSFFTIVTVLVNSTLTDIELICVTNRSDKTVQCLHQGLLWPPLPVTIFHSLQSISTISTLMVAQNTRTNHSVLYRRWSSFSQSQWCLNKPRICTVCTAYASYTKTLHLMTVAYTNILCPCHPLGFIYLLSSAFNCSFSSKRTSIWNWRPTMYSLPAARPVLSSLWNPQQWLMYCPVRVVFRWISPPSCF